MFDYEYGYTTPGLDQKTNEMVINKNKKIFILLIRLL